MHLHLCRKSAFLYQADHQGRLIERLGCTRSRTIYDRIPAGYPAIAQCKRKLSIIGTSNEDLRGGKNSQPFWLCNSDKYIHEVLCLVIVNVNVSKYVPQKCQKYKFVAITGVLSRCHAPFSPKFFMGFVRMDPVIVLSIFEVRIFTRS